MISACYPHAGITSRARLTQMLEPMARAPSPMSKSGRWWLTVSLPGGALPTKKHPGLCCRKKKSLPGIVWCGAKRRFLTTFKAAAAPICSLLRPLEDNCRGELAASTIGLAHTAAHFLQPASFCRVSSLSVTQSRTCAPCLPRRLPQSLLQSFLFRIRTHLLDWCYANDRLHGNDEI